MKKKLLAITLAVGIIAALTGCESTDRAVKDLSSEFGGGLQRVAYVYDSNGELIKTYKGEFDVKVNDYGNQVLFDLNGKRISLYNVSVIIEEQ